MIKTRKHKEPTFQNIFRAPEVYGIPTSTALLIVGVVAALEFTLSGAKYGTLVALGSGLILYIGFRIATPRLPIGWERDFAWWLHQKIPFRKPVALNLILVKDPGPKLTQLETTSQIGQLNISNELEEVIWAANGKLVLEVSVDEGGAKSSIICITPNKTSIIPPVTIAGLDDYLGFDHVYTLKALPNETSPDFMSTALANLKAPFRVILRIDSLDQRKLKRNISTSRRRSADPGTQLSDIDQDVTFDETSSTLEGLSRGTEKCVAASLILLCNSKSQPNPELFRKEKQNVLPVLSALGYLPAHRPRVVRTVTASHLFPWGLDPAESGPAVLRSERGFPVYFNPLDPSLQTLHWLVIGASGSGKSFLTGLILSRLVNTKAGISVLFIDHNYSFRRLATIQSGKYFAPATIDELFTSPIESVFGNSGTIAGLELSELSIQDKRECGPVILGRIEKALKTRMSQHPVFIVFDECWQFLASKPEVIQRSFREFRKFNAGAIAITQSLADFLRGDAGLSIFQNSPIKILLRQDEDLSPYQSAMGLEPEILTLTRFLRQKPGEYSEVLIKGPNCIRLGRLEPTPEEFETLRTDNIRSELASVRFG